MADGQSYFLILLALSVWLNSAFPIQAVIYAPYTYFGVVFVVFGLAMCLWSRSLFLKVKTTLSPFESPTSLLTSGPFRISRNPIYLGMAAILFGTALLLGTLVAFASPVLFVIIISALFIPGEEQRLEKAFGERYRKYKKTVRQWI